MQVNGEWRSIPRRMRRTMPDTGSESFAAVTLQPAANPEVPVGVDLRARRGRVSLRANREGFLSGPLDAALIFGPLLGAATSGRMGGAVPTLHRSLSQGACGAGAQGASRVRQSESRSSCSRPDCGGGGYKARKFRHGTPRPPQ